VSSTDQDLFILAARVGRRLVKHGHTISTAESCTGGWIAKAITDVAGSSQWFGEGFVTYSDEAKVRQLGVPRSALRTCGAVSEAVARAMARGAIKRAGASHAVAVTGIAGPDGGVPGKPVGTVWFCWARACGPRVQLEVESKRFRGSREVVRRKTVRWALARLLRPDSIGSL
jgi:nicotinamide-nucleotide amidase